MIVRARFSPSFALHVGRVGLDTLPSDTHAQNWLQRFGSAHAVRADGGGLLADAPTTLRMLFSFCYTFVFEYVEFWLAMASLAGLQTRVLIITAAAVTESVFSAAAKRHTSGPGVHRQHFLRGETVDHGFQSKRVGEMARRSAAHRLSRVPSETRGIVTLSRGTAA